MRKNKKIQTYDRSQDEKISKKWRSTGKVRTRMYKNVVKSTHVEELSETRQTKITLMVKKMKSRF